MKIKLLYIGKEDSASLDDAVKSYVGKIKFYLPFEVEAIPYLKNTKLSVDEQKKQEGQLFLKKIETSDFVVLLDERGKELTSVAFSPFSSRWFAAPSGWCSSLAVPTVSRRRCMPVATTKSPFRR